MAIQATARGFEILLVEDSPADVRLTEEALKEGKGYELQANYYMTKPVDVDQLITIIKSIEPLSPMAATFPHE